jgi:hypothetical protein
MQPSREAKPSLEAENPLANGMTHRSNHNTSNIFIQYFEGQFFFHFLSLAATSFQLPPFHAE